MALTARVLAMACVGTGALFVIAGVALIYPPAAVILAGLAIGSLGLFAIEVDK